MDGGRLISRYQLAAEFRDSEIRWSMAIETDDGNKHHVPIAEADDVPILADLCRHDAAIYFDAEKGVLRTGWNRPGSDLTQQTR